MPRESEYFRDNLERIIACFPGKEVLNKKDVCEFLGRNYRTVSRFVPFNSAGYVSVATLARCLSKGEVRG